MIISHDAETTRYIDVQPKVVDELNRRHIAHCDEAFISRSQETRPIWFEQRPMPDDSWEKERERKIALREWPER